METFIVLGLCFILYEALDLFQSCYNKDPDRPHHHRRRHCNFGTSANSTSCSGDAVNSDFCVVGASNGSAVHCDSISASDDTAHLMRLDTVAELDNDDDDQSNHSDRIKVYSICDRLGNRKFENNDSYGANQNVNNNNAVCVDDGDDAKLIVG